MFHLFSKYPAQQTDAKPAPQPTAPGTGITYKKDLIQKYKSDHHELLSLYDMACQSHIKKKYHDVVNYLKQMQDALRAHLLDEDVNFYVYMKHCYDQDEASLALISDYKKSMKEIGMAAFAFLKKYGHTDPELVQQENFVKEFELIAQALKRRIHAEEKYLYPLYRQPSEFHITP